VGPVGLDAVAKVNELHDQTNFGKGEGNLLYVTPMALKYDLQTYFVGSRLSHVGSQQNVTSILFVWIGKAICITK
jgi:hypothetical protein